MRKSLLVFLSLVIVFSAASPASGAQQESREETTESKKYTSSTSLSLLLVAGNAEEMTFALDTEQNLSLNKSQFELKGSVISSWNDGTKDSELYYGHLKYKKDFSKKAYFLGWGRLDRNELAGYLYRLSLTAGLGYNWTKKERFELATEAALGWNSEKNIIKSAEPDSAANAEGADTAASSFLSVLISNAVKWPLSSSAHLDVQEIVFINLRETADYRLSSLVSLTADVSKLLAIKISYQIHYNHRPVPGYKNADHYIFSSLVINL